MCAPGENTFDTPALYRIADLVDAATEDPRPVDQEEDREDQTGQERDAPRRGRFEHLRGGPAGQPFGKVVDETLHAFAELQLAQQVGVLLELRCSAGSEPLERVRLLSDVIYQPVADEADRAEPDQHDEQHHQTTGKPSRTELHDRIHQTRERGRDQYPRDDSFRVARDLEHQDGQRSKNITASAERTDTRTCAAPTDDAVGDAPDPSVTARTIST